MGARDDYRLRPAMLLHMHDDVIDLHYAMCDEIDRLRTVALTARSLVAEYRADPDGSAVALLFDVLAETLGAAG